MAAKVDTFQKLQNHDDVHISFEDQQKINKFAKHNARMDELKIELETKKNQLKNVEEALDEIDLFDEEEYIPFLFGEELLNEVKAETLKQISRIEATANDIKNEMNELKAQLYQRFGSNISLESDD